MEYSTEIVHINNDGEMTSYWYGLSPLEALKSAVLQIAFKNYNTCDYDNQEISFKEKNGRYMYHFGKNEVLCTRRL